MLHTLSARPASSVLAHDDVDDECEQTARTALLQRQQTDCRPEVLSHSLSSSPLRRVYLVTLGLLVAVGVLLCLTLLASLSASASASVPALPTVRPPISLHAYSSMQPSSASQQQRLPAQRSTAQPAAASSLLTAVSNAAGVRYAVERRYGGYIARENYNLHSNHLLTLTQRPTHSGCRATEAGGLTFQCDIFNLTDALAVCSSMEQCVGVVCRKERWEACQLKGRPVRHDNNHRFVALYKHTAAVEEAEAAWRQQADELSKKSQKGQLGTFNPAPCGAGGSKCVVSMGLYGSDERYTSNVLINARLLPSVLPGWVLRVYHDASVPSSVLSSLRSERAELLDMSRSRLQGGIAGMYWRFMVSEDESVDRWLIRDADCRISEREAAAVRAWMASGYSVHIMRDHPNHGRRMMGGMWGGVKHAVRNISQRIQAAASDVHNYNGDQEFLAYHVYPHIEFDQLSHDSWTCLSFTNSHPFPAAGRRLYDNSSFVGMIYGKDSEQQLNGDIRCCLLGREATIACREQLDDKWG